MTAPLEVVLVHRQAKGAKTLLGLLVTGVVAAFLNGVELMFLLPLAHRLLGTPDLHPGYLDCVLMAYLLRGAYQGITAKQLQMATSSTGGAR